MTRIALILGLLLSTQVEANLLKFSCKADDVHYINHFNLEAEIELPNKQILPDFNSLEIEVETTDRGFDGATGKEHSSQLVRSTK